MHTASTLLLTALLTAHAALGCCVHHEDCGDSPCRVVASGHEGHGHDESTDSKGDHPAAPKCEHQCCVYVASRVLVCSGIDLFMLVLPVQSVEPHSPVAGTAPSVVEAEEVADQRGPALHVWQCVWVI